MRLLIVGPPRAGNKWLKCLLSTMYALPSPGRGELPERPSTEVFLEWIAAGKFRDGVIFHQHFRYDPALVAACATLPATLVTILRNPYDVFRSSYDIQQREPNPRRPQPTRLHGEAIDSEATLAFIARGGALNRFRMGLEWLESGQSRIIRYEDLQADPMTALSRLAEQIAPVPAERIAAAVEHCSVEAMHRRQPGSVSSTRVAGKTAPGLTERHYAIFRRPEYADLIQRLGYEVR